MNRETLMSLLKGAALAVFGAVITALSTYVGELNLTPEQAAALTATIAVVANFIRKAIWPDSPAITLGEHAKRAEEAYFSGLKAGKASDNVAALASYGETARPRRLVAGMIRGMLRQMAKENKIDLTAAQLDAAVAEVQEAAVGPILLWILANAPQIIELLKALFNMSAEELAS